MDSKTHQSDVKRSFGDRLIEFLTRYRVPLLVLVVAIGVVTASLVIYIAVRNNRIEQSLLAVETLADEYSAVSGLDRAQREERIDAIRERADDIATRYSGMYAEARARMIHAQALYDIERFDEAATQFMAASFVRSAAGTYLAPSALMNAAVAFEVAGATERAVEILGSIADDHPESALAARALFSTGRLLETLGRVDDATVAYNRLIDDYATSSWTNLARNRIISLTVEGRIGG